MSLSTTGFGSQVDVARIQGATYNASNVYSSRRHSWNSRSQNDQGQSRRPTYARASRPAPKFDMNLAELFSDANTPLADKTQSEVRTPGNSYAVRPETAEVVAPEMTRPIAQRTPSMEYFMKYEGQASPQLQNNPHFSYGNSPPQDGSSGTAVQSISKSQDVRPADHDNNQRVGLDFLDFSTGGHEAPPAEQNANSEYNLAGMPTLGQNVGIDLGFGMAMDFQHDWSENPNYDILDGFFFGGTGGGPPSGEGG